MALANYQFTFGTFTFGAGTPYQIIDLDGLEGLPELRVQDDNRGYDDGSLSGRDFYNGRTLTFTIHTFATQGGLTAFENFNALQTALQPQQTGTQTLQFLLSTSETEKQIQARVRTRKTTVDPEYTFGYIRSQISFFCPEPRYFDNVLQTVSLSPTAATALGRDYTGYLQVPYTGFTPNPAPGSYTGRVYSYVPPAGSPTVGVQYGGGSVTTATITNVGWIYATPTITVNGPLTSVTVGALEQQASITVNITISASDSLVFDLNQRLVTLNGSSVRNLVASGSKWFNAPPGSTTYYMTAANVTAGTTAGTVTWRNAYI
jgi:hypothetical protein